MGLPLGRFIIDAAVSALLHSFYARVVRLRSRLFWIFVFVQAWSSQSWMSETRAAPARDFGHVMMAPSKFDVGLYITINALFVHFSWFDWIWRGWLVLNTCAFPDINMFYQYCLLPSPSLHYRTLIWTTYQSSRWVAAYEHNFKGESTVFGVRLSKKNSEGFVRLNRKC